MNRLIVVVVAAALVLFGGIWWLTGQSSAPGIELADAANAQTADVDTSLAEEMSLGNPDAPVTVIEYASFTCPHCRDFHAGPFKELKADFIDTGKIKFIYREVYFDQFGLWAGLLARCGGSERYFAITDLLYSQQREWLASGEAAGIAQSLKRLGKTVGFTDEQLDVCLQDRDLAQALVASYQQNATADGVRSTPSFVINGTTHSNMSYDEMQKLLIDEGAE